MSQALRPLGARVEIHDDHFPLDARDADWLPEVGRRGWVVLMKDKRIRRNRLERDALLASGVRAFVLTSGNLTGPEMAEVLAGHLPRMNRLEIGSPPPSSLSGGTVDARRRWRLPRPRGLSRRVPPQEA